MNSAKLLGFVVHELAHAGISRRCLGRSRSTADKEGKSKAVLVVMEMIEELRVEAHVVRRSARFRSTLRASFATYLDSVAASPPETKIEAAFAWSLIQGRTLAGVTSPKETIGFDTAARTMIGDDEIDQMGDLLQEAIQLRLPTQTRRLIEIAEEWLELVDDPENEDGAGGAGGSCAGGAAGASGKGDEGDESGDAGASGGDSDDESEDEDESDGGGSGDEEDEGDDGDEDDADGKGQDGDADDKGDDPAEKGTDGKPDYGHEGEGSATAPTLPEDMKELAEGVADELREIMEDEWNTLERSLDLAKSAEWASKVFGSKDSRYIDWREPTAEQRREVVKVAQFLSDIAMPTISKTPNALAMPPGRFRSREGVRLSAERSQGMMSSAKPWKGTKRRHTAAKPLTIGLATDTSGSMRWAEGAVAEFAYVYANAGHRIGARTAAVTFGDDVYRTARPGEVARKVGYKSADGGQEECDHAIAALDGVLKLTEPGAAAKLLLIVSDGALVKSNEPEKVTEWMYRLDKVGTKVVWINQTRPYDGYWINQLVKTLDNVSFEEADVKGVTHTPRRRGDGAGVLPRDRQCCPQGVALRRTVRYTRIHRPRPEGDHHVDHQQDRRISLRSSGQGRRQQDPSARTTPRGPGGSVRPGIRHHRHGGRGRQLRLPLRHHRPPFRLGAVPGRRSRRHRLRLARQGGGVRLEGPRAVRRHARHLDHALPAPDRRQEVPGPGQAPDPAGVGLGRRAT